MGSDNLYPANLQEYGNIIGGKTATRDFMTAFWQPLWRYLQQGAISGSEITPKQCYYDVPHENLLAYQSRSIIGTLPNYKIKYQHCTDQTNLYKEAVTFVAQMPT